MTAPLNKPLKTAGGKEVGTELQVDISLQPII
jgi:hypothetical protein